MKTEAVIFDMDGVISDTQRLHSSVESALLTGYGIQLEPEEITRRFAGSSDRAMFSTIFSEAGKGEPDVPAIAKKKWERMLQPRDGEIVEIPGTVDYIRMLHKRSVPMGVASASSMEFIELVLATLGIRELFGAVVSADEVEHGKPAPDIFLLAAKRLGTPPTSCVVIEDGVNGILAARAAGMQSVGLLTHLKASECPADIVVSSLLELDPKTIGL